MKTALLILAVLLLQLGCGSTPVSTTSVASEIPVPEVKAAPPHWEAPEPQTPEPVYPGKTIDQIFPIIRDHDFREKELKEKSYSIPAGGFEVNIHGFAPRTISRGRNKLFRFKTLTPKEYSSGLVGVSRLLGKRSKQIYTVTVGPGAVCCTNYWITDVSTGKPREIFRSEEFGSFRDPMEVFDADGDGIYELVQFDSAFRYFMDSCGSCSPEPRAVFKYNKKVGRYMPVAGIQQDFIKKSFRLEEKRLEEAFRMLKKDGWKADSDFPDDATPYIVDLFYLGEERKSWAAFERYFADAPYKAKIRAAIKFRVKGSKFLAALKVGLRRKKT